jgi:hypothetical protein
LNENLCFQLIVIIVINWSINSARRDCHLPRHFLMNQNMRIQNCQKLKIASYFTFTKSFSNRKNEFKLSTWSHSWTNISRNSLTATSRFSFLFEILESWLAKEKKRTKNGFFYWQEEINHESKAGYEGKKCIKKKLSPKSYQLSFSINFQWGCRK